MTGKSHLAAGVVVTAAVLRQATYNNPTPPEMLVWAMMVGVVASLLPDALDSEHSLLKSMVRGGGKPVLTRKLIRHGRRQLATGAIYILLSIAEVIVRQVISLIISIPSAFLQHRGISHSLLVAAGGTALLLVIVTALGGNILLPLAFGLGYITHLWCDTMTVSGVKLLAPATGRPFYFFPRSFRISTGKDVLAEYLALVLIAAISAVAFVVPPQIYAPTVSLAIVAIFITVTMTDKNKKGYSRR